MAKFFNENESKIKYCHENDIKIDGVKYTYTGFLIKNLPQGFGKLSRKETRSTYEGNLEKGKKNDPKAILIIETVKYEGGFILDKKDGYGEVYENHTMDPNL